MTSVVMKYSKLCSNMSTCYEIYNGTLIGTLRWASGGKERLKKRERKKNNRMHIFFLNLDFEYSEFDRGRK